MSKYRNLNYKVQVFGSQESAAEALGRPVSFNPDRNFIQNFAFKPEDVGEDGFVRYKTLKQSRTGEILSGADGLPIVIETVLSEYEALNPNIRPSPLPTGSPWYPTRFPPIEDLAPGERVVWAVAPADNDGVMVENTLYKPPANEEVKLTQSVVTMIEESWAMLKGLTKK